MRWNRTRILRIAFICALPVALLAAQVTTAQTQAPPCNIEEVIRHQNEHAEELANFADEAKTDLNAALATLYRTAVAYQALAVECGFTAGAAVEAAHELEHASFNTDTDAHVHDEAEEANTLAIARAIGDPDQGEILFNTVRPEVSFACATCHRVDSTETLVGPGLLGIAGHAHTHDTAASDTHDNMSGMNMGEATATPDSMAGMNMGGATVTPDSMAGMNMSGASTEATAAPEQTLDETVEFLRTSIIDPGAFVMPGFPDNLMPRVYGTIFTEEQINNLIAYLLTLD